MAKSARIQKPERKKHPNHSSQLAAVSRIIGQLENIKKMILAREYCPDIIQQLKAVRGGLISAEASILGLHISNCIAEAINSKDQNEIDKKTAEVVKYVKGFIGWGK